MKKRGKNKRFALVVSLLIATVVLYVGINLFTRLYSLNGAGGEVSGHTYIHITDS